MLQHVLVPLDGSELAEKALEYASQIVDPNGTITLVSVLDIPEYPMYGFYPSPIVIEEADYQAAANDLIPKAQAYLEEVAGRLRQGELTVEIQTTLGEPATVIVETAQNLDVSAIVMSTHGRSGFSRWLFGSVTNKVLAATTCPVLVVPGAKKLSTQETKAVSAES